jgi:flagellar assembly protein FliH
MSTIKLNLDDQVASLTSEDDHSKKDQSNKNNGNKSTSHKDSEYKEQIEQLQNQVEMLEQSLQNAREEAFQAGIEEGREQAKIEFKKTEQEYQKKYKNFIKSIEKQVREELEAAVKPILELAYDIAEKVITRELKHKQDYNTYLKQQINKYISEIIDKGKFTIHVHPEQIPKISKDNLNKELTKQSNFHIIENSDLDPADCIIETNDIKIDARISRQLENLKIQNDIN